MSSHQADVQRIDMLHRNILSMSHVGQVAHEAVSKANQEAEALCYEAREEQENSQHMLELAKNAEEVARVALIAADMAVAAAVANVAAAAGSPALPAALAELESARREQKIARELYEAAKKHRQLIEKRCELAQKCVWGAQTAKERLAAEMNLHAIRLDERIGKGGQRLETAICQLGGYVDSVAPGVKGMLLQEKKRTSCCAVSEREAGKPAGDMEDPEQKILKPQDVLQNLNPSHNEQIELLNRLYQNNPDFAEIIDRYRMMPPEAGLTQIKRNVAGRLAEEIVIEAFSPYGNVSTQERRFVVADRYTKVDLLVTDLKLPVVLGRGQGMMAPKGGTLAIEVKAGQSTYIRQQEEHLAFQVAGHTEADASCVICTRNIQNIPPGAQRALRQEIAGAGSRMLGMLPAKEELDCSCLEYVYGKEALRDVQ